MSGRTAWITSALCSYALAALTIRLTTDGNGIATVWPANAVVLALLLSEPNSRERLKIACAGIGAAVLANVSERGPHVGTLLYGLCNASEILLAANLLRSTFEAASILGAPRLVARFVVIAGFVAPAVSAVGGANTASIFYDQPYTEALWTWYLSDALGLLVFTPFFRALFSGEYLTCFRDRDWLGRLEAASLQIVTGGLAFVVFFVASRPLLFLLFAPVMLATSRAGRLGTKLSVLVIAVIGAIATIQDVGPIAQIAEDHREQQFLFQAYLAALLFTCLPAAADLTARRTALATIADQAAELRARTIELSRLAHFDSLTGVLNRAAFRERLQQAVDVGATVDVASLVALDLDLFKAVNDRFGHQVGDRALLHLATVLQAELRSCDALGRIGGDEFLVLLPGASHQQAQHIAERLATSLRHAPLRISDGVTLTLSMSWGVASLEPGLSIDQWIHEADTALYASKRQRSVRRLASA